MSARSLFLTLLLALAGRSVAAQQQAPQSLTMEVIQEAIDLYNRAGTVRLHGDSRVAAGSEIIGDLAVLDGRLEIEGRVAGNVLLLHGDLVLARGAVVEGGILVIGGAVEGLDSTRVSGAVRTYRGGFAYELQDGMLVRVERRAVVDELAAGREFDFGRSDVVIATRPGYNRVEGLPILVGPRLTLGRSNPTMFETLAIYRTATGGRFNADDFGYSLRAEQYFGGRRSLRAGVRVFSEVAPIESAGLSDRENSLATFVLHHDYRDHFERNGWSAYLGIDPVGEPWSAAISYTDERNTPVIPREPLSIIDNGEAWRPEPNAAQGYLRTISGELGFDTRNAVREPTHGWWLRGNLERALGGSLRTVLDSTTLAAPRRFWTGQLDLRRYARLGPSSRLAVRAFATGSLTGAALPVQRQHVLGGEGSLPGFTSRRFDCGAQRNVEVVQGTVFQSWYGCDRAVLVQLEYQTDFKFLRGLRNTAFDQLGLLQRVHFALFFDAGRAWNEDEARNGRGSGNNDFAADGGFGLRLGPVGLYWAVPFSGRGEPMNFFLRLGPRL